MKGENPISKGVTYSTYCTKCERKSNYALSDFHSKCFKLEGYKNKANVFGIECEICKSWIVCDDYITFKISRGYNLERDEEMKEDSKEVRCKDVIIKKIYVKAKLSSHLKACQKNACIMALENDCFVELEHNGKLFLYDPAKITDCDSREAPSDS